MLVGPTGASANDRIVMDEVIETTREGVRADGTRKRPNLTFVNFPQIDVSGHGSGVGPGYDAAINSADTEIGRFVQNQKQLGLWKRTTMIVLSDHSMDTTPQKTSLTQCYRAAGIDSDDFVIVQNGSAALVYLADRTDPGRFRLLKRLRAASALWYRGGRRPRRDDGTLGNQRRATLSPALPGRLPSGSNGSPTAPTRLR